MDTKLLQALMDLKIPIVFFPTKDKKKSILQKTLEDSVTKPQSPVVPYVV